MRSNALRSAAPIVALTACAVVFAAGGVSAADLDEGYAPLPPPVARVYERPVIVERPIVEERVIVERPVVVERPLPAPWPAYRPYPRYAGIYRPFHRFPGPRFAYGPRPWGWYR